MLADTISIAGRGDGRQRQELRRLPARQSERRHTALERRHTLLEHGRRGIHDAAIDVAEFLQAEQARGVLGIVERERCGLIDRHGTGVRGGIRVVAGVQRARIETEWTIDVFGGH